MTKEPLEKQMAMNEMSDAVERLIRNLPATQRIFEDYAKILSSQRRNLPEKFLESFRMALGLAQLKGGSLVKIPFPDLPFELPSVPVSDIVKFVWDSKGRPRLSTYCRFETVAELFLEFCKNPLRDVRLILACQSRDAAGIHSFPVFIIQEINSICYLDLLPPNGKIEPDKDWYLILQEVQIG